MFIKLNLVGLRQTATEHVSGLSVLKTIARVVDAKTSTEGWAGEGGNCLAAFRLVTGKEMIEVSEWHLQTQFHFRYPSPFWILHFNLGAYFNFRREADPPVHRNCYQTNLLIFL